MKTRMRMKIGEVFRYARPYSTTSATLDGMRNLFYVTAMPGAAMPLLEKGINPIAKAGQNDGSKPAILISSSPHKTGSRETPWQDVFNPDFGHVRYFGDN